MKLTLTGRVPSKKNSRILVCRGKFPTSLPSKAYKDWHTDCLWQLKPQLYGQILPIASTLGVEMILYSSDLRKADLSNKFESVADLLVDAGVLEDDNWFVIPKVTLTYGGQDKANPRVEIVIHRVL